MKIKSINRPYTKRLECICDEYTYRSKSSRKKGMYKVIENGYFKSGKFFIEKLKLVCISCGKEQIFELKEAKK